MRNFNRLKLNRILAILLVMTIVGSFSGCVVEKENDSSELRVVAVSYAQYDFARKICGSMANVTMLSKPGGDVHGYEPSLGDIRSIADSDVFIYNGGESDEWVEKIFTGIDDNSIKSVRLFDYVELLCGEHGHTEHHNHEHSAHQHFDEHIQSSPRNAILMVEAICDAICETDPANREKYEKNSELYINEIKKLDKELSEFAISAKGKKIMIADRFPFVYLAEHYGLEYEALFAGCSQENDANPMVMIDMIEEIKSDNTGCIYYTDLSDGKMAKTISDETGAKVLRLYSCDGISREEFEYGPSYVDLMMSNVQYLTEALG